MMSVSEYKEPKENIEAVRQLIRVAFDNPNRPGLDETPERVLKSIREMCKGNHEDPGKILKTFEDGARGYNEIILVKKIDFVSLCEHHMLPFSGVAHVAYIPNGRIVGLSKLARLVDVYARRLQVQERICVQVVEALDLYVAPKAAACVLEAGHSCMSCRGVRKSNAVMVTSSLSGAFLEDDKARSELMSLIKG